MRRESMNMKAARSDNKREGRDRLGEARLGETIHRPGEYMPVRN